MDSLNPLFPVVCVKIILQWDHYISVGPWIATAHEMGHNFGMDHDEGWYCCGLR